MIVIVIGPSGAGKTTVGSALARSLGWSFYEGDDFHPPENVRRMKAGVPLGDAERAPWLAALADLVSRLAQEGLSAVVTCSALKRAYRAALVGGEESAAAARFVFLDAPPEVLAERLAKRRGHFFPQWLLPSQLADVEPPHEDEPAPVTSVDSSQPPDEIVRRILDELGTLS